MENNNMKDRLIALIHGSDLSLDSVRLADHLIANGVIVLLCKIGDTVYQVNSTEIYELEVFAISIVRGKPYYETESIDFDNDAIGTSLFLTREEAEMKAQNYKYQYVGR